MAKKRPSYLDQIFAAADRAGGTDISYEPLKQKKGGSLLGGLKHIGKSLLNTLSVPQAVGYTLTQKLAHAFEPQVSDLSWKNLGGGFYGKYKGGAGLLTGLGVDSKAARTWGGLGLDIFADPLNLAGVGLIAKVGKAQKAIQSGADIFKAVKHEDVPRTLLSQEEKIAGGKALTQKVPARSVEEYKVATEEKLAKAVKGKKRQRDLRGILDVQARHDALEEAIDKAVRQHKKVKPLRQEFEALDKQLRKEALEGIWPANFGPEIDFVAAGTKAATTKSAAGSKAGRTWAKTLREPIPSNEPGKILDEMGFINEPRARIQALASALEETATRKGKYWSLALGLGKKKKHIPLFKASDKPLLGDFARHLFRLNPAQKIAHGMHRSVRDLGEGAQQALIELATTKGLSEADLTRIGVVASAQEKSKAAGAALRQDMIDAGTWTKGHDEYLDALLTSGKTVGKAEGLNVAWKEQRMEELQKSIDEATAAGKPEDAIDDIAELNALRQRGEYFHQTPSKETVTEYRKAREQAVRSGRAEPGMVFNQADITMTDPHAERQFDAFNDIMEQDFRDAMSAAGLPGQEIDTLTSRVSEVLGFGENQALMDYGVKWTPMWDAALIHTDRMKAHYGKLMEQELERLIRAGVPRSVFQGYNLGKAPGAIGSTERGAMLQKAIAYMKFVFTTINPSHFVNNLLGDYTNRQVNGYLSHLFTRVFPGTQIWKLGQADADALKKTIEVGGRVYSGAELLMLSRLSGLGRGFVGADINTMIETLHKRKIGGFMGRLNLDRENAQRLETWMKHMHNGDDPFRAAAKTLRVHFDYSELTDFERVWMRNLLLFYTWLKKNSMLHAGGMATRPGLYQAYGDIERNRQQIANEPEYYGRQGALTLPWGNIFYANPMNDIWKWDLSQKGIRQGLFAPITPPARVPLEILTNKNLFTGGDIESYTDQNKPYWLAELFGNVTVDGRPAMDAQLVHALSSVLGPQASQMQSAYMGDTSGADRILRWLGLPRMQQDFPEKFAKQQKVAATNRKAAATRKRNKEQPR